MQKDAASSDINTTGVSIRKAEKADAETVADIGRKTFYETWRSVNTEEDLQMYLLKSFNTKEIAEEIQNQGVIIFLLAYVANEVAGYAKLRNDRNHDQLKGKRSIEMERIYVLKKFQDKKIGKALMDESLSISNREKYELIWLGVNQENFKAIDFYKRYGFEIFGTKKFILGTAIDEDYLMKKELKSYS